MQKRPISIKPKEMSHNVSKRINSGVSKNTREICPKSAHTNGNPKLNNNDNFQIIDKISKDDFKKILRTEINITNKKDEKEIPKNMNLFRHILTDIRTSESDIEWIFDLRSKPPTDFIFRGIQPGFFKEPKFYSEDLQKYKEKVIKNKTIQEAIPKTENIQTISHMVKNRIGEAANITQIKFELNLRNYKTKKSKNKYLNAFSHDMIEDEENKEQISIT